jgi:hypothetical protein
MKLFWRRDRSVPLPSVHLPLHLAGLMLLCAAPALTFDVVLDPAEVNKLLVEIERLSQASKAASDQKLQLDGLYAMGERVLDLVELMNKDRYSHGAADPSLVGIIERRLRSQGVAISEDAAGYHYDLGAFREYLRLAPSGKRAADAHFVLIGFDEPGDSIGLLNKSIADKMQFIHDYPKYPKMALVKFLLAQQHVQLGRVYAAQKRKPESDQHKKIAEELYRQIVKLYPKSPEAEPAADYLEQTGAGK